MASNAENVSSWWRHHVDWIPVDDLQMNYSDLAWIKYKIDVPAVTIKATQGSFFGRDSANERRRYIVTSSLIDWALTQNDPCDIPIWLNIGFKCNSRSCWVVQLKSRHHMTKTWTTKQSHWECFYWMPECNSDRLRVHNNGIFDNWTHSHTRQYPGQAKTPIGGRSGAVPIGGCPRPGSRGVASCTENALPYTTALTAETGIFWE